MPLECSHNIDESTADTQWRLWRLPGAGCKSAIDRTEQVASVLTYLTRIV